MAKGRAMDNCGLPYSGSAVVTGNRGCGGRGGGAV